MPSKNFAIEEVKRSRKLFSLDWNNPLTYVKPSVKVKYFSNLEADVLLMPVKK